MRAKEFTKITYETEPYEGWNGDGIVVRAFNGREEIGHVIFEPTEDDASQWYAVDVEVEEPYQRRGIATAMYDMAKKSAKRQGAIIVRSHTQTDAGQGLWQDKTVWESESNVRIKTEFGERRTVLWVSAYVGNVEIGEVTFEKTKNGWMADTLHVYEEYRKQGIATKMYDAAKAKVGKIIPSPSQTDDGKSFWNKKEVWESESYQPPKIEVGDEILKGKFKNSPATVKGFTKDKHNQPVLKTNKGEVQLFKPRLSKLAKEPVNELFDPESAFPLEWDEQFDAQGEVHAEAHDADGELIHVSFIPASGTLEDDGITELTFSRGGSYDITKRGDAAKVLATVMSAIVTYIEKYKPEYLVFSAKEGSRASLYKAMIQRSAAKLGYVNMPPAKYDDAIESYIEFSGGAQPFVLTNRANKPKR